jgi:hypothetical protein
MSWARERRKSAPSGPLASTTPRRVADDRCVGWIKVQE